MQAVKEPAPPLTDKQRDALISLLSDEDLAVYHLVRDKISAYGPVAVNWLKPHALSSDPTLRRRSVGIIELMERQSADNDFLAFCLNQGVDLDVEQAVWMLARTRFADINIAAYEALLDSYASDISEQIDPNGPAEPILAAINDFIFGTLGFAGNEENYYDPQNSYLNRVLDRRTGNPISLCLIYMLIGKRLRLPISGIAMPGHFLCRYQNPTEEFYIDAFNKGKLLSRADCVRYLVHTSHGFQDDYLAPARPRRIILRMCSNLHEIAKHLKDSGECQRFRRYIVALEK